MKATRNCDIYSSSAHESVVGMLRARECVSIVESPGKLYNHNPGGYVDERNLEHKGF